MSRYKLVSNNTDRSRNRNASAGPIPELMSGTRPSFVSPTSNDGNDGPSFVSPTSNDGNDRNDDDDDDSSFVFDEPLRCKSVESCLANLQRKSKIALAIGSAQTIQEKKKLEQLYDLVLSYYKSLQQVHSCGGTDIPWGPTELKSSFGPGVYSGHLKGGLRRKFGMSEVNVYTRVNQQPQLLAAAALLMGTQCREIVPVALVQAIVALELPKLARHPSKQEKLETYISMQLVEGYYACAYVCNTDTILEGLVEQPTATIRQIFDMPKNGAAFQKILAVLATRPIPEKGMECITNWITLKLRLYQVAEEDGTLAGEILRRHLPPLPPEGGFVKLIFLKTLFGSKYHSYETSITIAPREKALHDVLAQLRPLLDGSKEHCPASIKKALERLQGDNYSHYVHPPTDQLATSAKQVLQAKLARTGNHHIEMERVAWEGLVSLHGDWVDSVIDIDSIVQLESIKIGLTWDDRVLWILPSFFLICAPTSSKLCRVKAIRAFLLVQEILVASGNAQPEYVSELRRQLLSFVMTLHGLGDDDEGGFDDYAHEAAAAADDKYGLDEADTKADTEADASLDGSPPFDDVKYFSGSWRAAAHNLLPLGFLRGAQANVLSVSKVLGITYLDALYIRYFLEPDLFQKLLEAHGVKSPISPMESNYTCNGLPAVGDIPAVPCKHSECTKFALVGGKMGPVHGLYGHFMCTQCMALYRELERRERASLENLQDLDDEQQARLDDLCNRVVVRRDRVAKKRREDVEAYGLPAVQQYERAKNQDFQQRQNARFLEEPNGQEQETLKKRKAAEEQKRQAKGVKKKTGFHRESKANKMYPTPLMAELSQATRRLVQLSGKVSVESNCIIDLFDLFVVQAHQTGQLSPTDYKLQNLDNGKPFPYLEKAYHKAVEGILEKEPGRKRAWRVLNPNNVENGGATCRGVTDKELVQRVFDGMNDDNYF